MTNHEPRSRTARLGGLGFGGVALGCAALSAYLVGRILSAHGYANERVRPVVVAKHALSAAQPLTLDALHVVSWPESTVPAGAFRATKEVFAAYPAPIPTTGILAGEPVLPARLAGPTQGTGLAALVRPGFRAVAVKTDDAVGRAGLVYPGAHVDVLATIRDPEGRGPSTRIAVENCLVLAVEADTDVATRPLRKGGDTLTSSSQTGTVVTVEVSPADAEVVSLAGREGIVDLALRNGSDTGSAATRGATPHHFSAFALREDVSPTPTQAPGPTALAAQRWPRVAPSAIPAIQIKAFDGPLEPTAPEETRKSSRRGSADEIETYHAR